MKSGLLKDFEGVKGLYGVIGLRIFKSIKEIFKEKEVPKEELPPPVVVVSPVKSEEEEKVEEGPKCSGLCELVKAVGFSKKCSSKCGVIITDNPNDTPKDSCSESLFDRVPQANSTNNIPDIPKPSPPGLLEHPSIQSDTISDDGMLSVEVTYNYRGEVLKHSNGSKYRLDAKNCNINGQLRRDSRVGFVSKPWDDVLDSNSPICDSNTPFSPISENRSVDSLCFDHEADNCDLPEMKELLGLPNVESSPLTPVKSPCKSIKGNDKRKREVVSMDNHCVLSPDRSSCTKKQKLSETVSSKLESTAPKELFVEADLPNTGSTARNPRDDGYSSCSPPSSNDSESETSVPAATNLETASFEVTSPSGQRKSPRESIAKAVSHYNDSLQTRKKGKDFFQDPNSKAKANTLDPSLSEEAWIKLAAQSLKKILLDIQLIPDRTYLLLHVFRYVYNSSDSSVKSFSLNRFERAVVASLYEVEAAKRLYLKDLVRGAIESLQVLIVGKTVLHLWGLCGLCRLYAELCRREGLDRKPVLLAAELLRARSGAAPVLIASLVGVWSEPFRVTDAPDDMCLHSAIAFGVSKSRCDLPPRFDGMAKEVLAKHLCPIPDDPVVREVVEYLFAKIHLECVKGSHLDIQETLMAAVIFCGFSDWDWTQKNVLDNHIVPSLSKYEQEGNEAAFETFTNLYAEILSFFPEKSPDVLLEYYRRKVVEGKNFVKDSSSVALIRLLVSQERAIPGHLLHWLQGNIQRGESIKLILKRKKLTITSKLTLEDIRI